MFQTKLRELREAAGYSSQQSFADAFGVAQSTVGGWEAGKREPNYATTIRLARFFGVTIDTLLLDDPLPPSFVKRKEPAAHKGDKLTEDEQYLIAVYSQLDEEGRRLGVKMMKTLLTEHAQKK